MKRRSILLHSSKLQWKAWISNVFSGFVAPFPVNSSAISQLYSVWACCIPYEQGFQDTSLRLFCSIVSNLSLKIKVHLSSEQHNSGWLFCGFPRRWLLIQMMHMVQAAGGLSEVEIAKGCIIKEIIVQFHSLSWFCSICTIIPFCVHNGFTIVFV